MGNEKHSHQLLAKVLNQCGIVPILNVVSPVPECCLLTSFALSKSGKLKG